MRDKSQYSKDKNKNSSSIYLEPNVQSTAIYDTIEETTNNSVEHTYESLHEMPAVIESSNTSVQIGNAYSNI